MNARKKAAERLRQLVNENCKQKDMKIKISYDNCLQKKETS